MHVACRKTHRGRNSKLITCPLCAWSQGRGRPARGHGRGNIFNVNALQWSCASVNSPEFYTEVTVRKPVWAGNEIGPCTIRYAPMPDGRPCPLYFNSRCNPSGGLPNPSNDFDVLCFDFAVVELTDEKVKLAFYKPLGCFPHPTPNIEVHLWPVPAPVRSVQQ